MAIAREDDEGDELLGRVLKRCAVCRRELHPWESVCPDDGGAAVLPDALEAEQDPMLARLLAMDPVEDDDASDGDGATEPTWPTAGG